MHRFWNLETSRDSESEGIRFESFSFTISFNQKEWKEENYRLNNLTNCYITYLTYEKRIPKIVFDFSKDKSVSKECKSSFLIIKIEPVDVNFKCKL